MSSAAAPFFGCLFSMSQRSLFVLLGKSPPMSFNLSQQAPKGRTFSSWWDGEVPEFFPVAVAPGFLKGAQVLEGIVTPERSLPPEAALPLPMGPVHASSR